MTYGLHKDLQPEETISMVMETLNDLGIDLAIGNWETFNESHYSVTVFDSSVAMAATNGKGITKQYALASACAEFMERLQNGYIYRWSFGLMDEIRFQYPDEKQMTVAQCIQNSKAMGVTPWFLKNLCGPGQTIACLPFYDCLDGTISYFPTRVLYKGFTNTGMCAGNTPEEALVQGICEIFERYVSQLMFLDDELVFPTLAPDQIQSPEIAKMLNAYSKAGMQILIKDMTLGGRFPVLGVVLLDRTRTRMRVSAGSFVTPEIALERCLTELSQGLNAGNIENHMTDIKHSMHEYTTINLASEREQKIYEQGRWRENKSGRYPGRILRSSGNTNGDFRKAFMKQYRDSESSLHFALGILRNQGLKLYARDVSFLGFPTYFLYCPSISERFGWQEWTLDSLHQEKARNILLRLNVAGKAELDQLAGFFEARSTSPYVSVTNFSTLTDIHLRPSGLFAFPRFLIWVMIYIRNKAYDKALDCMDLNLKFCDYRLAFQQARENMAPALTEGLPTPAQIHWLCLYLKMKVENCPNADIARTLSDIYGAELTDSMHRLVTSTDRLWGSFAFPDCGDCRLCPINNICDYDRWKSAVGRLNAKMQADFPSQEKMARLFGNS